MANKRRQPERTETICARQFPNAFAAAAWAECAARIDGESCALELNGNYYATDVGNVAKLAQLGVPFRMLHPRTFDFSMRPVTVTVRTA